MLKYFHKNKKFINYQSGMTLVELLVVLAIFMIVAGLTIFDYGRFRSSVSLQNLADDIGLAVRSAQNYAIGVHSSQTSNFSSGYGIHFSTANPVATSVRAGSNKSFITFSDLNANKVYDYPALPPQSASSICNASTLISGDECTDMLNITSDDIIYSVCPTGQECTPGNYVDITFIRPNPDARVCIGIVGSSCSVPNSGSVDVRIKNNQSGDIKTITISSTGQISIK